MTVPSQVSRDAQFGDGVTTVFTVPFRVLQDIAMRVYVDDVQKALTTDFLVSGVGAANTTVTFLSPPANLATVTFLRQVALTQETDYVPNDPFPAESHENALDKLTMIAQQQQDALLRSVRLGPTLDPADYSVELPDPEPGAFFAWNGAGNALENVRFVDLAAGSYSPDAVGAVDSRLVGDKLQEILSVKDFGAVGDGVTDDTAAFSAAWQSIIATFVDNTSEDYVTRILFIPPGEYRVNGSINWCNLKARNTHVMGWGAVIRGYGAANNTIEMIGSRWVQVHGLTVFGDEADPPKCGILIGPERSGVTDVANGNNYFNGVNVTGYFGTTAFWNIGSETTTYVRSRFSNRNTSASAYVYIGDGAMQFGATSAYMTLRPAATLVSFTNNKFYACDLRNIGGGNAVAIEATSNWGFDNGCYFLSFNAANIQVYARGVGSHSGLVIDGLFENAQTDNPTVGNTGCKYTVEFVTNGLSQAVTGFTFRAGIPHYANACMKVTPGGSIMALRNAEISINRAFTAAVPFFDATGLTVSGRITTNTPAEMNLNGIAEFNGYLYTRNFATQPLPPAGAYVLVSEDDAVVYQKGLDIRLVAGGAGTDVEIGNETDTRVSILGQATFPRIRPVGTAADIDFQIEAKGAGKIRLGTRTASADAPISGYLDAKDTAGNPIKIALIT